MKSQKKKENGPRTTKETGGGLSSVFVLFLFFFGGWLRVGEDEKQTKNDETHDRPTRHNATRPATEKRLRTETRPAPALYWKKTAEKKTASRTSFPFGCHRVRLRRLPLSLSLSLCWPSFRPNDTDSSDPSRVFFLFVCFFFRGFCFWVKAKEKAPPGWAGDWLAGDWQGLWHPPWSDRGSTGWPFQGRPAARRKHGSRNRKRNSLKKNSIRERPNGQTGCHPLETR